MALNYFGLPKGISCRWRAVLLFAVVAGGSFRRWERFLFAAHRDQHRDVPAGVHGAPERLRDRERASSRRSRGGLNSTLLR